MGVSPVLQATGVGHSFGNKWLFRNVEISVCDGDVLVLTGHNGSGKSTLLKCLAGLVRPLEGKMRLQGRIGYSALDMSLYGALTAAEHVELAGGDPASILALVGLEETGSKACKDFSSGMKARVKLAVALALKPAVLLLDEPTASLDESGRETVHRIVREFQGAVILATNDPLDRRLATHELSLG